MPETLTVPVETISAAQDSALATHEALDEAAHQEIAQTEDEDYKWLTDRLDEHSAALAAAMAKIAALETLLNQSQEQSRTLLQTQAQMITTLTENLSALSATAIVAASESSKLIQTNSEATSTEPTETVVEKVTEAVPESQEVTRESSAEHVPKEKRNIRTMKRF